MTNGICTARIKPLSFGGTFLRAVQHEPRQVDGTDIVFELEAKAENEANGNSYIGTFFFRVCKHCGQLYLAD